MLLRLLPYLLVFLTMVALIILYHQSSRKTQQIICWVCLCIFILFFGLRGDVGDDFRAYKDFYEWQTWEHVTWNDFGFAFLIMLFKTLHLPFRFFIFILSALTNLLLFRFIYRQGMNVPFMLCVFLGMSGVVCEVDFIRSTLCMMLFVNSLHYLERCDNLRFFALNLMGLSFHVSALLYLPLYFFYHRAIPRWLLFVLLCLGISFWGIQYRFLDFVPILCESTQLEIIHHIGEYVLLFGTLHLDFSIATLEMILTCIAVIVCYDRLIGGENMPNAKVAVAGFCLYFFFYSFFGYYAVLATRLANQYVFSYWILWPMLLKCITSSKVRRVLVVLMLLYLIVRLMSMSMLPQWQYTLEG